MNLSKCFELQRKLDAVIVKEKHLTGHDLFSRKRLALITELAELANEFPEAFKFWSNKKNQYDKALVELVDVFHFLLSIGLDFKRVGGKRVEDIRYRPTNAHSHLKLEDVFTEFIVSVAKLNTDNYLVIMNDFLALIQTLGFSWEEFEVAYHEKLKINHERQNTNY